MNADRNLASAAECGQSGTFRRHRKARIGVVKESHGSKGLDIAFANLEAQRSLARCGAKFFRIEAFADVIGLAQSVESGSGEQNRVHLPLGELAQSRVHVAAKLDRLNVFAQRLQLRAAPLAAGANTRASRQFSKTGVIHRDKDIARIDARRRGRKTQSPRAVPLVSL